MAKLLMSPLPTNPTDELLAAHDAAKQATSDVRKCEAELRKARKLAEQRIMRYENLVLEFQGQLLLPLGGNHDGDAGGTAPHDPDPRRDRD